MKDFVHLHVHTQYSILDGASHIPSLIEKAKNDGMKALAITDHGNMFGVKKFHVEAIKAGIKPIIGCEVYVANESRFDKKEKKDRGAHLILLAKNLEGYHNLMKLVSYAWIDGFYYNPRIDKELLRKYNKGIIASSACLGGEVPKAIYNYGVEKARKVIMEFKEIFGDDFYLELMRHETGDPDKDRDVFDKQQLVNKHLLELGEELNVKCIATNDVHYINAEDSDAHDRLICLSTGKDLDDPNRLRYTRQEFLKTTEEMNSLFADNPQVLENTIEIEEKIESYELDRSPIMPEFEIPEEFGTIEEYRKKYSEEDLINEFTEKAYKTHENYEKVLRIKFESDYLTERTYAGAKIRWGEISNEIKERLDFELGVIKRMGFPGYFLIVEDLLIAARDMNVVVGPGRGSAAGSAVAYSIKITDIDPIKYNLLFERFLNPERISMPDIDIDFDDDGREDVLKWVVEKYGKSKVAHIITFGKMATKSAIKDVARIHKLPLSEANRIAKFVPEKPGMSFKKAYKESEELRNERNSKNPLIAETMKFAEELEGSVRQTGLHACGIIIGRDDLVEHIPISTSKESELLVSQYDGKLIEDVGMLKMDFLGLKTLSIIKDAVENIKISRGIDIDISAIPLDDEKTYELYSKGETTGLFQFESDGMKKHLKELKPNRFEDLIAMNALYRPGPMDYIPSFINRKHGKEPIHYTFPEMKEVLSDTYGVTVYQEQVMLLSQKLAGFTKGQADSLRKAMGKKIIKLMDENKAIFFEGCKKNNYDEKKVAKIWEDWEKFAEYAFNKSHSTCYSYISFQTAYLKAHYPAEFMGAVLSRNLSDIKKITIFMDECKRMGINVLGPDVNESYLKFNVNKNGDIRFGLAAIKGMGEMAAELIIKEREKNGLYKDVFDFVGRVNLQSVNKRNIEALAYSGGFDCFTEINRYQFFLPSVNDSTYVETLLRFGSKVQEDKSSTQISLFGDLPGLEIENPAIPTGPEWSELAKLNKEKELIGIYLSAHPLDKYKIEINNFCSHSLDALSDLELLKGKKVTVAGIITEVFEGKTKTGNIYGSFSLSDYVDKHKFFLFSEDYIKFKNYFSTGYSLMINGVVQERRYTKTGELEFKIQSIEMLSEALEKIKKIVIKVPINSINDKFIEEIKDVASNHKGTVELAFSLYDDEEAYAIEMFSRNYQVRVTHELIDFFKKNHNLDVNIYLN